MTIEVVSGTGATFEYDPLQDRESNTGYNDGRPSAALPRRSRDIVRHHIRERGNPVGEGI